MNKRSRFRQAAAAWAVVAIGLIQSLPARAEQTPTADALYFSALAAMHAVPDAPYLKFDYVRDQKISGNTRHELWHVVERTRDGRMHFSSSGSEENDAHFVVRPDLFLKPQQTKVVPQQFTVMTDLPSIGSVTARTTLYDIAIAGQNDASDCPGATHLHLSPKPQADPYRYNLRDLWVTAANGRICKASAIWDAGNYFGHQFPVEITLYIASGSGLVDHWTAEGTVRTGPFHAEYAVTSAYAALSSAEDAPAELFDR
jgi:hypothetical protein